jgi:murein DD-endopeptidase MepM/ murein hydrolase activator NlpD
MRYFLLFVAVFLFSSFLSDRGGENRYPKNYFRSPIDFQIRLSGSFGEVRKNHIHSGIDIRTEGVTGKPIYAVADGFISRIFISPGGFGKALYIAHPNGYTTLYGHLEKFNPRIWAWIRAKQYKDESFEQDVTLDPGVLPVKKGEIIAYSGNTGMSGGPHLHFEIRDTPTQEIIDPSLFGLPLKDNVPPRIFHIKIYPKSGNSRVGGSDKPVTIDVAGNDGHFHLITKDSIKVSGDIIFAIEAFDYMDDSSIRCGISSIRLFVDTACVFFQKLDRFAFSETRYVNSILDYPAVVSNDKRFERSYIAPNNKLRIYQVQKNRGVVSFSDSKPHRIRYVVGDAYGNTSQLDFSVRSTPPGPAPKPSAEGRMFLCKSPNKLVTDDIVFDLPSDALYEDLDFTYYKTDPVKNIYSGIHHLQNEYTPLHTYCDLSIRAENLPQKIKSKAIIVKVSENNHFSSVGGTMDNGFVKSRIREFGDYAIAVDTTRPVIHPVNIANGKNVKKQGTIQLKLSDNLTGVKSYRGTMNGKWILMDLDAKSGLLTYAIDDHMKAGRNEFRLMVKDGVGNETVYNAVLTR